jgi:hypothetical protein
MLTKRDQRTLDRLVRGNGIDAVLAELRSYAFVQDAGQDPAWPEIYTILAEAASEAARARRRATPSPEPEADLCPA